MGINDDGVSAFRGHNARSGNLADFLTLVKSGKVPRGSVLVVEDQDRLARDQVWSTLKLLEALIENGVYVGDALSDHIIKDLNDPLVLMSVVIGAQRAYEYSLALSVRKKSSWQGKRERLTTEKFSKTVPSWLKLSDDRTRFEKVPENVKMVRTIFKLACEGMGLYTMAKTLHAKGIMTPTGKRWQPANISKIIKNRAVLGEFQPHECVGKTKVRPIGNPVPNYFPAIIEQDVFDRANFLLTSRAVDRRGRANRKRVNLFRGLLWDARSHKRFHIKYTMNRKKTIVRQHLATDYIEGGSTLDYQRFLDAFILNVEELDPDDFSEQPLRKELVEMTSQLASLDYKIATVHDEIKRADNIKPLLQVVQVLDRDREALKARIGDMSFRLRNPAAETVVEVKELIRRNPEMIRAKLRMLVTRIWVLVSQVGLEKHCTVQVNFRTGLVRKFWFSYVATKGHRHGTIDYRSTVLLTQPDVDLATYCRAETADTPT
jgi:DNA invertase Pin-like site-specific DNA recombinase